MVVMEAVGFAFVHCGGLSAAKFLRWIVPCGRMGVGLIVICFSLLVLLFGAG